MNFKKAYHKSYCTATMLNDPSILFIFSASFQNKWPNFFHCCNPQCWNIIACICRTSWVKINYSTKLTNIPKLPQTNIPISKFVIYMIAKKIVLIPFWTLFFGLHAWCVQGWTWRKIAAILSTHKTGSRLKRYHESDAFSLLSCDSLGDTSAFDLRS